MSDVVRFPPLPPIPEPPPGEVDERQQQFQHIVGTLTQHLSAAGSFATANMTNGYRASAVDVGRLQDVLEEAIARFDMAGVRERWEDDLGRWMSRVLLSWIQRCKSIHYELEDNGIRVQLETQDDHGYYRYEFDVFPGRKWAS